MAHHHQLLRRLLWAMTSILAMVAIVALPVVGDDRGPTEGVVATDQLGATSVPSPGDGEEVTIPGAEGLQPNDSVSRGAVAAPTTTGVGADATTTPTGAAAPGAAAAPGTEAPTTAPLEDLGEPVDPGPASPPRSGVYRYRTSGAGAGERGEEDTTLRVEERGRSGDEVRLSVTTAGGRLTSTSEVAWRPDGVRTLRTTFTFGESRGDCDWEPDVVDLQFPLRPGASWSSESSCAVSGVAPTPIPLSRSVRAEVIGLRRVRIDGQVIDVWAIRRVEKLSGAGASGESTAVALFSPRHGLDVEVSGTISSGQGSGEFRQVLLGLQPGPL